MMYIYSSFYHFGFRVIFDYSVIILIFLANDHLLTIHGLMIISH